MSHYHPLSLTSRTSVIHEALVDGVETKWWEYESVGGASTIVLIHGFRGDHHGLQLIADALPEFRVIIPDLPAFGESGSWNKALITIEDYGRWLRAFLKETGTSDSTVLGHSFGSIVVSNGLAGARKAPIILLNPISQRALTGPKKFETALATIWYQIGGALPERAGNAWLSNGLFVRIMSNLLVKTRDKSIRRFVHEQHSKYFSHYRSRSALIRAYQASISNDVSDFAKGILAPVLLVAADLDDITPLTAQVRVRELFPDAKLEVLNGVGHLAHYEQPIQTARAIRTFLSSQKP